LLWLAVFSPIDLVFSPKVHLDIVEAQFMPSSEAQSIKRIHRIGQTEESFVTIFTCKDILFERLVADKKEFASAFGDAARMTPEGEINASTIQMKTKYRLLQADFGEYKGLKTV
jgi:hypothetical protein